MKAIVISVSNFRSAPALTAVAGSTSNDTVIVDTSSTPVDIFGQSGTNISTNHHHHQSLGDEVTYVTNSNSLIVPSTTTSTTTFKATTVTTTTEVGFLTSEAEGTVETVVVRSNDISGSDESEQLNLMDAYPIGQITSTY